MAGKGVDDKYVSHQIRPPRKGTETIKKPCNVQGQNKSGTGNKGANS